MTASSINRARTRARRTPARAEPHYVECGDGVGLSHPLALFCRAASGYSVFLPTWSKTLAIPAVMDDFGDLVPAQART